MAKGLRITRREGQSVYIGNDIVVTVENSENGNVGLRISAPSDVGIHRDPDRVPVQLKIAASIKKGR
ncbi:translational regulator [Escherichia phage Pondi]|nr:translational regulator [Escherichia phage Pondi]